MQCTELRSNTYGYFYDCFKRTAQRVKANDGTTYQRALQTLQKASTMSNASVMEEAIKLGFGPAYMEKQKKKCKREVEET